MSIEVCGQLTLVDLHIRDGLPLVHGDEPPRTAGAGSAVILLVATTAEVDDQLAPVAAQGSEDGVQARLAEVCVREEERRYDDLLIPIQHNGIVSPCFRFFLFLVRLPIHCAHLCPILVAETTTTEQQPHTPHSSYLLSTGVDPLPRVLVRDAAADLERPGPGGQGLPRRVGVARPEHDDVCAREVVLPVQVGKVRGCVGGDEVGLEGRRGLLVEGPADDLLYLACVQVYAGAEYRHFSKEGRIEEVTWFTSERVFAGWLAGRLI